MKFYIKVGKALIFMAVLISYVHRENPELVEFRFGLICTFIMFAFIGAPLLSTVSHFIKNTVKWSSFGPHCNLFVCNSNVFERVLAYTIYQARI